MSQEILGKIEILQGNIADLCSGSGTHIDVDVIVNAAKPTLMGGSGVDGAIHSAVNNINGIDFLKNKIKGDVVSNPINARDNIIRCNTSEVVITKGYNLCSYIFHTVGPKWDGGSKSCIISLQKCYENIIDNMVNKNCETIAIPVISSGSYGFSFELAARIQVVSIYNYLIKLKNCNRLKYDQIRKIYLVVYTENDIEQFKEIIKSYEYNVKNGKKSYYQSFVESEKSYVIEIEKYDTTHRGYLFNVRMLRLFLLKCQRLFFITYFIKTHFSSGNWEKRRTIIEAEVFIKMLIPIAGLFLSNKFPNIVNLCIGIFIISSMLETIIYVLHLIFLADIQNPSANIYRSIILLFENYIELTFGFAFLYNLFKVIKGSTIIKCICFAFTNSNVEILNNQGFILSSIQSCVSFIFGGLILSYFISNFKQRKFY
ncbi:hypothetical protein E4V42_07320 [Clostridium estertheticum]|uniref:Macro domain-containing protein n=1 Tax=Clostridium estertheticum TaxID=238834 RepID=A0A5N7IZJ4_9CLOT|nr:macro domain-containing protein [Clostridium estertheticum]MPQ31246.1 hypothetical protein [Clostridium estertheticum]MPQ61920.1 hypothetical protein [Clostridium estertheticum]